MDYELHTNAERAAEQRAAMECGQPQDRACKRRHKRERPGYDGGKYEGKMAPTSRISRRYHSVNGPKNRGNVPSRDEMCDVASRTRSQERGILPAFPIVQNFELPTVSQRRRDRKRAERKERNSL
jgi:hypothetical protein